MYTYQALIRLPKGQQQKITVQADTEYNARQIFESLYGKGNILGGLTRLK